MDSMKKKTYGRSNNSRREGTRRLVKKSSSGFRNIKNTKNLSVDVREYFTDGKRQSDEFAIPIEQDHGKNRRGISREQLEENPEDLNLVFYNFNSGSKEKLGKSSRIMEEEEELEDDFDLGPTNCKYFIFILTFRNVIK